MAVLVTAAGELHAQYAGDALRFSQTQYGSTARFKAIGAQTGIGGDLSSIGANPAGIGLFTGSEFSITPEINSYNADALYLGKNSVGKKDQLNLSQAAVVWHAKVTKPRGEKLDEGWISFNFGLGYNRTNAFGNAINFSGTNGTNSVADYYAELASKYGTANLPDGSLESMAYENYLIGYDPSGYYFPETDVNNLQTQNTIRSGSQSEVNFTFGGNYGNTLYIGASVGIASINYNSSSEYTEDGYNVTEDSDYSLSFRQDQMTKGSGFNGKLGAIYRPSPAVRIGATFQSPTWYAIDDSYSEVLDTRYAQTVNGELDYSNDRQDYDFNYRLRTPMKISGGLGFFFNNQGFISGDIDYIDYSTINFSSTNPSDANDIAKNNRDVLDNYQSAVNVRVGAEYKLDKSLMLRAGYGIQGSPYKNSTNTAFDTQTYSGGLGYRINNLYIDLAYQNASHDTKIMPYVLKNGTGPAASLSNTRHNVFLTIGSRF